MADLDDASSGTHVKIKIKAPSYLLADQGLLKRFLYATVKAIGARPLGELIVHVPTAIKNLNEEPWADEGGISGVVVLSVSHVACHTWPKIIEKDGKSVVDENAIGEARIDVDSCRPFDPEVLEGPVAMWQPTRVQYRDLTEALRWEDEPSLNCCGNATRWHAIMTGKFRGFRFR